MMKNQYTSENVQKLIQSFRLELLEPEGVDLFNQLEGIRIFSCYET